MQHLAKEEDRVKSKLHKPKKFWRLIKEIDALFDNIIIFNALIIAMILFLVSYMILMIIKVNVLYSLLLPFVYLLVYLFFKLREKKYPKVEHKFPQLNERIRTAVDNIYAENPVVDELRREVSANIRGVDYASFFKERKTSLKVLLIILLCFGIIFLAKYDVEFSLDFERAFGFIQGGEGNETGIVGDIISATTGGPDEDIFGEEALAELGEDELTVAINKVGYEINMDDVKDPDLEEFEESLFPPDVGLENAEVYNKDILKEHQELVKNYFRNMAEG